MRAVYTKWRSALRRAWADFVWAAWLGWQIDSNWTDPWLFAVYSIIKPVSSSLILVVMFLVAGRLRDSASLSYIFVGNAFFIYVSQVLLGVSWTVYVDREEYRTLKYVYLGASRIITYLLGRAFANFGIATMSVAVLVAFGRLALRMPLGVYGGRGLYGLVVLVLGIAAAAALGLGLAGIMLVTANHGSIISESLAGLLYLLAGVVFPIDVLPSWMQKISLWVPFTYWTEGLRRVLVGTSISQSMARFSDAAILAHLAVQTVAAVVLGLFVYAVSERVMRYRGLIDMLTEH